jgi:hypothetical protein
MTTFPVTGNTRVIDHTEKRKNNIPQRLRYSIPINKKPFARKPNPKHERNEEKKNKTRQESVPAEQYREKTPNVSSFDASPDTPKISID